MKLLNISLDYKCFILSSNICIFHKGYYIVTFFQIQNSLPCSCFCLLLLHDGFLLSLFFSHEDGGEKFFRNVCWHSPNYNGVIYQSLWCFMTGSFTQIFVTVNYLLDAVPQTNPTLTSHSRRYSRYWLSFQLTRVYSQVIPSNDVTKYVGEGILTCVGICYLLADPNPLIVSLPSSVHALNMTQLFAFLISSSLSLTHSWT
jgi:hypothetical protein